MEGALYILLSLVVVGAILYLFDRRGKQKGDMDTAYASSRGLADKGDGRLGAEDGDSEAEGSGECCGQHLVCEKDTLSPFGEEIVYYDDEELDRFRGKKPEEYLPEEVEEIRDVLMTLREEDLAGWARSVTQRRIELPEEIREELLMMVRERRGIK